MEDFVRPGVVIFKLSSSFNFAGSNPQLPSDMLSSSALSLSSSLPSCWVLVGV